MVIKAVDFFHEVLVICRVRRLAFIVLVPVRHVLGWIAFSTIIKYKFFVKFTFCKDLRCNSLLFFLRTCEHQC
jgi:hypothetical protein